VKGISEGAGVEFEDLLVFSFEEELSPGEHCTTLALKCGKTIYFAHNEDWDLKLPLYIVKAKPKKKPRFLSVAYAGHFPGTVVGYNELGLIYAGNSIDTRIDFGGVPKSYCLRSFLEFGSVDQVVEFIGKNRRAIGNNSLLVSRKEKRIASIEWSPRDLMLEEDDLGLVHTNHFLSTKMKSSQTEPSSPGSLKRYMHAEEKILKLKNPKLIDVKKIMTTHFEKGRGICQHWEWMTLSSIIIDTSKSQMMVSEGNPCKHKYKSFEL
jgi:hypothetical protein